MLMMSQKFNNLVLARLGNRMLFGSTCNTLLFLTICFHPGADRAMPCLENFLVYFPVQQCHVKSMQLNTNLDLNQSFH